jgi:hypothetical protein
LRGFFGGLSKKGIYGKGLCDLFPNCQVIIVRQRHLLIKFFVKGVSLAKTNFSFDKRKKELEKKKKKEEKLQRKQEKSKTRLEEDTDQVQDEENPTLSK